MGKKKKKWDQDNSPPYPDECPPTISIPTPDKVCVMVR